MSKPGEIAAVITMARELDRDWLTNPAGRDDPARYTPWMPFPLFDYIALLAEAMPVLEGSRLLELGCGIGSRMLVAQELFGLDVSGFDRVDEYVAQAVKLNLNVWADDALTFTGYGHYDVLWFNRPFLDPVPQRELEAKVWEAMAPGAVVIAANLEAPPPRAWMTVLDDWEVRRGIWWKPPPAPVA